MTGPLSDPRKAFGAAVTELAESRPEVVVLSTDSGKSSGFGDFAARHPERYFELGIMEQAAVGVASGLATTGRTPVFCAIAPFVTVRPYEMLRNDLGYMRQNVKIVGRNSGVTYSDLGATHHSLEDFAITRMIPGFTVLAPVDPSEIKAACAAMLDHRGPVYMRIGNEPIPDLAAPEPFVIGRGRILRAGSDVTVVATGSITGAALAAAEVLAGQGVAAEVLGLGTVWPLDEDLIAQSAGRTGRIVTVEEHYVVGGLGTMVRELSAERLGLPVAKLGLPHCYSTSGPYHELLAHYGLDPAGLAGSIKAFLESDAGH
ncbi:MAG: transketolase family protein [Propionibacteriaceae bacterium]|jgi:transketolase|nr:transketolase family protein [Propionibacteriaceae bacterium]